MCVWGMQGSLTCLPLMLLLGVPVPSRAVYRKAHNSMEFS